MLQSRLNTLGLFFFFFLCYYALAQSLNIYGVTFLGECEVKVKMAYSWDGKSLGLKSIMEAFFFFVA